MSAPHPRGSVVISTLVTLGFIGILALWIVAKVSTQQSEILSMLVGSLAAAFGQVVNYWLGSSAGSAACRARGARR